MTAEIVWEDPPEVDRSGPRQSPWADRLAPLREHPGKWANLGEFKRDAAVNIKQGRIGRVTAGEFDAVMRKIDPTTKMGTLYVRYVGGES